MAVDLKEYVVDPDTVGHKLFMKFLTTSHAEENLVFLDAARVFLSNGSNSEAKQHAFDTINDMYDPKEGEGNRWKINISTGDSLDKAWSSYVDAVRPDDEEKDDPSPLTDPSPLIEAVVQDAVRTAAKQIYENGLTDPLTRWGNKKLNSKEAIEELGNDFSFDTSLQNYRAYFTQLAASWISTGAIDWMDKSTGLAESMQQQEEANRKKAEDDPMARLRPIDVSSEDPGPSDLDKIESNRQSIRFIQDGGEGVGAHGSEEEEKEDSEEHSHQQDHVDGRP